MTDRATLEALLARVLEGTGPDRELDGEIAVALFGGKIIWKTARYTMDAYPARRVQNSDYVGGYQNAGVLAYTESLDAAITLVPPGAAWVRRTTSTMALVFGGDDFRMAEVHIEPCRALIAACLKARMEGL